MRFSSRIALSCPEYLHKQYAPNAFPEMVIGEPNPILEEFKNIGLRHELEVIEYLKSNTAGWFQVDTRLNSESQQSQTALAILDPQIRIIFGSYLGESTERLLQTSLDLPKLEDPLRVSRPDILVRVGYSVLESWAPVDIKSHAAYAENKSNSVYWGDSNILQPGQTQLIGARLSPPDLTQLSHYVRHLQNLGLASPESWAGIIGREIEKCAWMQMPLAVLGAGKKQEVALHKYDLEFAKAIKVIQDSVKQNLDRSFPVSVIAQNMPGTYGCAGCEYREVCLHEMRNFDDGSGHVTLLARVTPSLVATKIPLVSSIREAAKLFGQDKFEIETKIRADVWISKIPQLLDDSSPLDLPAFDIEIDIDLENSQEALLDLDIEDGELLGEGRVYLYGYGIHHRIKNTDWKSAAIRSNSDYSNTAEGEMRLMLTTWNLLVCEVNNAESKDQSVGIFHYSSHERTWWRKFAIRYQGHAGVPPLNEMERFIDRYFVDLYDYTRKISFPTTGYSVKLLAKEAGFDWSVEDPGGANSLLKYKLAINNKAPRIERDEAIAWLKSYNEDDVRATYAVRNYIRELFP